VLFFLAALFFAAPAVRDSGSAFVRAGITAFAFSSRKKNFFLPRGVRCALHALGSPKRVRCVPPSPSPPGGGRRRIRRTRAAHAFNSVQFGAGRRLAGRRPTNGTLSGGRK
jgi:hypothetical protein